CHPEHRWYCYGRVPPQSESRFFLRHRCRGDRCLFGLANRVTIEATCNRIECTGNKGCFIRGQERDDVAHVLRGTEAPQWYGLLDLVPDVAWQNSAQLSFHLDGFGTERCPDGSRTDSIYSHVIRRQFVH